MIRSLSRRHARPRGAALPIRPRGPRLATDGRANPSLALLDQGGGEEALTAAMREPQEWARLWALAIIHHRSLHGDPRWGQFLKQLGLESEMPLTARFDR